MNYLLYGEENFLIEKEIEKIVKKSKLGEESIINYDLELDSIKDIIDDCQTISLFEPKKVVIINNCNYFNKVKNNEDDVNILLEYLSNSNPDTILIIISHNSTIDGTKKISKKIKEVGTISEFNKVSPNTIVKKLFDGYKISSSDIDLLISRVGEDISILSQEVEKLKIYKIDEKEITKKDILECATFNIDTDIFKFIDNIVSKNKEEALTTYYEMLKNNEEPIKLIALLASKFRLMYQASVLHKDGMNNIEIASFLNIHQYPVKLALQAGGKYPDKVLLNCLEQLADLDSDIKTGNIDPELGLELFILKN